MTQTNGRISLKTNHQLAADMHCECVASTTYKTHKQLYLVYLLEIPAFSRLTISINRSTSARFVGHRYTTRPAVPTIIIIIIHLFAINKQTISYKHNQKYALESFSECTGVSNVVKVG